MLHGITPKPSPYRASLYENVCFCTHDVRVYFACPTTTIAKIKEYCLTVYKIILLGEISQTTCGMVFVCLERLFVFVFFFWFSFFSQVTGLPTVLGIKNGQIVDAFTGLVDTQQLRGFVEKLLK